ncbi:O-antigen ligase family protein [Halarcobacter anaerophilus]|uniref:O-antigen polymerase n=1 Tax=Halarcobacter anaerophilus TaxID=877500 RepID=A0A4Q0Y4K8_9BACT|nr:O-antigen ligase family protein [Halarcobacter anaerophilus]QDF29514.1 O-antigen ligase family protein [Halarcobacter anaerophilus]RXJ64753.1 hypothetical protein CRV06_02015 [Halarcobacter anaerophilus]
MVKKNQILNYLEKLLIILFSYFILIDMINGYLIRNNYLSISLLLKSFILILTIFYLVNFKEMLNKVLIILGIILFYFVIHFFILEDVILGIKGLDWLIKFFSIVIFYLFFSILIKQNKFNLVIKIAKYSFIFLLINFLFGFLDFGYPMYGHGDASIGTRGLIYAGNEIGAAIIISGAILQMYFIEKKEYLYFLIIGVLMMGMGALLTSKVSILASILITFVFPFIKALERIKNLKINKKDFIFSVIIFLFLPLIALLTMYYALFVSNLFDRLSYAYGKLDLITIIFSHRNIWAEEAINIFFDKYNIMQNFFGSSQSWFIFISENKMVEIDIIDFLMSYGIFGVLIIISFLFWLFYKNIFNKNNKYAKYLIFMILLLIAISSTAGHILTSGTAGFLIAILFSMINLREGKV